MIDAVVRQIGFIVADAWTTLGAADAAVRLVHAVDRAGGDHALARGAIAGTGKPELAH
ncbi:MAG: hypothetical protein M5T61_21685 [Acidimicrobiia bacterium]|nr:hypothetical protein [Acidimicrobiia bacterium]